MMAIIEVLITDMGNGASYCSHCEHCLDGGDPFVVIPPCCPRCGEEFTDRRTYTNTGGSDF